MSLWEELQSMKAKVQDVLQINQKLKEENKKLVTNLAFEKKKNNTLEKLKTSLEKKVGELKKQEAKFRTRPISPPRQQRRKVSLSPSPRGLLRPVASDNDKPSSLNHHRS